MLCKSLLALSLLALLMPATSLSDLTNQQLDQELANRGYTAARKFFVSPAGTATGAPNDAARPYANWDALPKLLPGDCVIYRGGQYSWPTYADHEINLSGVNGTAANPIIVMAYPGETVNVTSGVPIQAGLANWVVVDGFHMTALTHHSGYGIAFGDNHDLTIRNCSVSGYSVGVMAMQGMHDVLLEGNQVLDSLNHGIYLGSRQDAPSSDLTLRGNHVAFNDTHGFQFNGVCTNLLLESNTFYGNAKAGISLLSGVHDSVVRDNLIAGNIEGIVIFGYDGDPYWTPPYAPDLSGNVIEGNRIFVGQVNALGLNSSTFSCIAFSDSTNQAPTNRTDWSDTVIRDNVLATWRGPALRYTDLKGLDTLHAHGNHIYRQGDRWSAPQEWVVDDNGNMNAPKDSPYDLDWAGFSALFPDNAWGLPWLPGDANMDGAVDVNDIGSLISHYDGLGSWPDGDFNLDGLINVDDLGYLASNFGKTSSQVPEPASLSLLGLLLPAALRRGRKRSP